MIITNGKNEISHIDNTKCNQCITTNKCIHKSRRKFINRCLPFNNFDESKKNILNFDKTSYIYFYKKNIATYYLKKDFSIKLINIKPLPYENIDILTEEILITVFNINNIEIPGYYLFCNYIHTFNIFTTYYGEWFNLYNNNIINDTLKLKNLEKEYDKYNIIIENMKEESGYYIIESENKDIYQYINKYELKLKLEKKIYELNEHYINNINKELIYKKNNKIIEKINIWKNKLKDNKQNLKLILNDLKINKEYIDCTNNLKILSNQHKELSEHINKCKKEQIIVKKMIDNIFQINKDNNFIKLSYMFNIFNISLLCEKYFDIIKLLFSDYIIIDDIIEIFKDFSLVNIYYLINYKKNIKQIYKDENFMNFMNNKFSHNNDSKPQKKNKDIYDNIIKIEHNMNNITEINIINIYKDLHVQIVYIHKFLNEIEKIIPNYKKLFLMAIISYRNNNTLINNTWGFLNKNYIYNFIINNKKFKYLYNNNILLNKYYKPELPILYENDSVTYKNINYGNCMENTIFQFLKVIFWNMETNTYNFNKIKEIINEEHFDFINNIFINITNEKSLTFINKWVEFITEITYTNNFGDYNFDNKIHRVEIKPILNNLVIALKYLIRWNDTNIDNITFMTKLITNINKDYKIIINTNINSDKIELIFNEKKYIIELDHLEHASFVGSKYDENNILDQITSEQVYTDNLQSEYLDTTIISFSNLNAYIIYSYFYNKNDLFNIYITKLDKNEKIYLINAYIKRFKNLDKIIYYLISNYKHILEKDNITNICNKIVLEILNSYSIDKLLLKLNKDIILEFSNDNIIQILKYNNNNIKKKFILKLKENEIYKHFNKELWIQIIDLDNIFYNFIDILDFSIFYDWGISEWISMFYFYNKTPLLDIKNKIEELIRTKYRANFKIDFYIQFKIIAISEYEWINIFKNSNMSLDFFIYISQFIKNKKLYTKWYNDDTWNYFLIMINHILNYNTDYNFINKNLDISSYLDKIFIKKNIIWNKLDKFLKTLIYDDIFDKYYEHIIVNKIYDKFSLHIYNILLNQNHKIIYDLIINNECIKWSEDLWEILINNINFIKLIPFIKTYERYKNWTENIWLIIINQSNIICLFKNIILQENLFETFSNDINIKLNTLTC